MEALKRADWPEACGSWSWCSSQRIGSERICKSWKSAARLFALAAVIPYLLDVQCVVVPTATVLSRVGTRLAAVAFRAGGYVRQ